MNTADRLQELYQRLEGHFGPQDWWPGETPLEIMVGAVLTQNTNWTNVEKAIANLKQAGGLDLRAMLEMDQARLAELIRPSGYYNIKAARLRNLLAMIQAEHGGDLDSLFGQPLDRARRQLLGVKGIGPETADSMLLYAGDLPIFVVDAYTFRILARHDLADESMSYFELQELFMENLPADASLYNEFHALIVMAGKYFCKKANRCAKSARRAAGDGLIGGIGKCYKLKTFLFAGRLHGR